MMRDELVARLLAMPNVRVIVPGYEFGYDDIEGVASVRIGPDDSEGWWHGRLTDDDRRATEDAIVVLGHHNPN